MAQDALSFASSLAAPARPSRASGSVHTAPGAGGPLAALERALQVLLSPMDYPDWRSWRREVHQRLLELTGAEQLAMYTPLGGSDTGAWCVPGLTAEWASLPHHRPSAGAIAPPQAGALPMRDVTTVEVDFGGAKPAVLCFTDGRRRWWRPDAERVATLRAVLPALRAGLASWRRAAEQRRELIRLVDALPDVVFLFDRGGTLLHANAPGRRLMDETEGGRVRNEAQRVAWAVDAVARRGRAADAATAASTARELRLGEESFRLRGLPAPEPLRGADGAVMVLVERVSRAPLTDEELRQRFQLTAREVEVTRLVAQGLSNQEIAERLGVSFFTARNHVERLLVKLGVGGRARVAAMLAGSA